MWILFAFGSALFAGLTSILAKCGIKNTDSNVATAIRTIIVLIFSWIMVFLVGAQHGIGSVSAKTWTFLILSGLATGASWLCYFRALQIGDVDKVVPVDKSSAILSILLAFLFLHESISPLKLLCVVLIGAGTYLMITKKETSSENSGKKGWSWFFYALGSAVFASLTSILGKVGIENIDSNLGTAIRTTPGATRLRGCAPAGRRSRCSGASTRAVLRGRWRSSRGCSLSFRTPISSAS